MEKKLITAIALSILIIVAFQYFVAKPVPPTGALAPKEVITQKGVEIQPVPEPQNLPEEKELEVTTGKYILTFSNIGGSIKDIKLTAEYLGEIINMLVKNEIVTKIAKQLLETVIETGESPIEIVKREGLGKITDKNIILQVGYFSFK